MATPSIPADFKPLIQGYAIGSPEGVSQIPVGGGAARSGLEWDRGKQPFQVSMNMPAEKFAVWTVFFHHTIKRGAVAFSMPLDSGFGLQDHVCNMVPGTYTVQRAGGQVSTVSFTVESESQAYDLTEAQADALIDAHNGYASTSLSLPRDFKPVISGYGFNGPGGAYRSDVASGTPGYASQWDRDVQQFRVTLILDAEKFKVWTAFFHHKVKKGSRSFEMPLDSGFGLEDHKVTMIAGSYGATRNGTVYVVSFAVEAESAAYGLSSAEAAAFLDLWAEYGSDYNALLARIAKFANVDTLVLNGI